MHSHLWARFPRVLIIVLFSLALIGSMPGMAQAGSDSFGYTFASIPAAFPTVDRSWTLVGIGKSSPVAGPYSLPFSFKFYEKSYTTVYIAAYGYLTFNSGQPAARQSKIPSSSLPNAVVAPYWAPLDSAYGKVYYKSGANENGGYFAVLWDKMAFSAADSGYSFEAVLYEDGSIDFQYAWMNAASSCVVSGIENDTGQDGLVSSRSCVTGSHEGVRFTRPAEAARVFSSPRSLGQLARPGQDVIFPVTITNTGGVGADTYDLTVRSAWPVRLYNSADTAELTDTNGGGAPDTGPLGQGDSVLVNVHMRAPDVLNIGDSNQAALSIAPSAEAVEPYEVILNATYAAPFTQTFWNEDDGYQMMKIFEPGSLTTARGMLDPHGYAQFGHPDLPAANVWGITDSGAAETPNGNIVHAYTSWQYNTARGRSLREVYYSVTSQTGAVVKGATRLSDLSAITTYTAYDAYPTVAAAGNGKVGILFRRMLYNSDYSVYNQNLYLYVLDQNGAVLRGPVNITNNTVFGSYATLNQSLFNYFAMGASGSNLILAYDRDLNPSYNTSTSDIYSVVYNPSTFAVEAGPQKITADTAGDDVGYEQPALAALPGGRSLLSFRHYNYFQKDQAEYVTLDSSGAAVSGIITIDASGYPGYPMYTSAAAFSGGRSIVAWKDNGISYAILNANQYILSIHSLALRYSPTGEDSSLSVTADGNDHAILTWIDADNPTQVIYALVDSDGNVLTAPMPIHTSRQSLALSFTKQGSTTHTIAPTLLGGVDLSVSGRTALLLPSGGAGEILLNLGSTGDRKATGVRLTAAFPAGLEVSAPGGNCAETTCAWNLPDMDFLSSGAVRLAVQLQNVPSGTTYPVQFSLAADQDDGRPGNNSLTVTVAARYGSYLPITER